MILYVSATIVPPPGLPKNTAPEQMIEQTDSSQLGAALREFLTSPPVGELLAMNASVVIVVSRLKVGASATIELVQKDGNAPGR